MASSASTLASSSSTSMSSSSSSSGTSTSSAFVSSTTSSTSSSSAATSASTLASSSSTSASSSSTSSGTLISSASVLTNNPNPVTSTTTQIPPQFSTTTSTSSIPSQFSTLIPSFTSSGTISSGGQFMGIDQLSSGLHGLNLSGGLVPSMPNSSPFVSSALTTPNVTNLVTVKLTTVEDFLTWKTQFTALLISHNLLGFVDGSCPPPPLYVDGVQLNPHYITWIRIDQSLRSWLFATLSREVLVEVHDLAHSFQIWDRLQRRFFTSGLARVMELKRSITTIKKSENQSMEVYLREIKIVADSLAAINSPLSDNDLVQHTLFGLNSDL